MEAIVEHNYEAQEPDELTLKEGDIITDIKVMMGGWWEGTLKDKRGMFPDNFVKVIEPRASGTIGNADNTGNDVKQVRKQIKSEGSLNPNKSDKNSIKSTGSKRRFCKVLFNYEPRNEDELTLVLQDSIEFLGEVEEGWWRGRLKGRIGVFPSNFVSPPMYEELEKHKVPDKRELCKVLFPYEAASVDELTLNEGDIITLLSRNAPDKGWWIGELDSRVGLFPDNFVEVIEGGPDHQEMEQKHKVTTETVSKHSLQAKNNEKIQIRKNLDVRNVHADTAKKTISTTITASSGTTSMEKKSRGGHSITSNLKRFLGAAGTNNGNGNIDIALGEELDGVERGEGAPLSHLTASRAKAPRRRPPSSQRLRRYGVGATVIPTAVTPEDTLANGNANTVLEQLREEKAEILTANGRKKALWVEELKLNQLERRKAASIDRVDKSEEKKERGYSRLSTKSVVESINKLEAESEETKQKDKSLSPKPDIFPLLEQTSTPPGTPAYVPYTLYNQLLERVVALEEKQAVLQQTMGQILEQFVPFVSLANSPD